MITIDKIINIAKDIKEDKDWVNDSHTNAEHRGVVSGLDSLIRHLKEIKKDDISISWSVEDIRSLGFECTDDQGMEVLRAMVEDHDANYGITWATLDNWCGAFGLILNNN